MRRVLLSAALLSGLLLACDDAEEGAAGRVGGAGSAGRASAIPSDPATPVAVDRGADAAVELAALRAKLDQTRTLTTDAFVAAHPAPAGQLGYDPMTAAGLDQIQASPLALTSTELPTLAAHGFAISTIRRFPSFAYGYQSIYSADLPLYISADSILHAVHRGYDDSLARVERSQLVPDLRKLLVAMRAALSAQASGLPADVAADLDLFLGVGLALLDEQAPTAVAGGDEATMKQLVAGAVAHKGEVDIKLFGVGRLYDFSQFTPRGHYAAHFELGRYFRAMTWFGRTELRLLEPDPQGRLQFRKRQVLAAVALRGLLDGSTLPLFGSIDDTIGAFVGEHDSMTVRQIDDLLAALGAKDLAAVAALDDATIAGAIARGGFGAQRIASQLMVNGTSGTLPLSSSFQLFGQRYTVDAHVLSNVVYDRAGGGAILRMMPDPLDAAYAALGNDAAVALLAPQLQQHPYAPDLAAMRLLVDAHPEGYWSGSLGARWMSALRAMSPNLAHTDPGFPAAMRTEAWSRRVLNTQLASWAELRHDTILYAKQSYTGGAVCEYPDAYVDPYPEVFARLGALASRGGSVAGSLTSPSLRDELSAYYSRVGATVERLRGMAEKQLAGAPLSADDLAFVNQAVSVQEGCGGGTATGWYPALFPIGAMAVEAEPTIADVHTQPTDEGGAPVGRVLHVATALPRLMVVTVDTCKGPRAYVGLASHYAERITDSFERLDDQAWEPVATTNPGDVPWLSPVLSK